MLIMSHRGFWQSFEEKNKLSAFERSFNFGFGIETDIRDCNGSLIVSHDMAVADSVKVNELFELYNKYNCFLPLALNIKSDGLQVKLKNLLELYNIQNYFVLRNPVTAISKNMKKIAKSVHQQHRKRNIADARTQPIAPRRIKPHIVAESLSSVAMQPSC